MARELHGKILKYETMYSESVRKNFLFGVEYKSVNKVVLYLYYLVGSVYTTFLQGNNPQGISVTDQDEEAVSGKYCFININD